MGLSLRNNSGEIRLIWIIFLVILGPFVIDVAIGIIPLIYCIIRGIDLQAVILQAVILQPGWGGALFLFVMAFRYVLVTWFMIVMLEKKPFSLTEIGLNWRKNNLLYIVCGVLLGIMSKSALPLLLYVVSTPPPSINFDSNANFFLIMMSVIPNAFAEEIMFRAYLQTRMIGRLGVLWGVLLTSTLLIGLHFIVGKPGVFSLVYWIAFDGLSGYIYYRTRSLYFVTAFHSTHEIIGKFNMNII